ncbi:MAG TPA: gephyrin-like molybdotransferase Glp [Candidatus Eremiobacteraceae bacterium]|nr:gephyrin-like molybdotransferase Glp [Candidatus Eremiobacteraceae bacterium]
MLSYADARQVVIAESKNHAGARPTVTLKISDALGYILAQEIRCDRDYPPFHRSTRDGYAVQASEANEGARLRCVGEIKAGDTVSEALESGTCIQIMTGAAVPLGADAVVMIEFTRRSGDSITFERPTQVGQNIVRKGSEAHAGDVALQPGTRLGFAELAVAAQVGASSVRCHKKPRVAILSTGDEVVPISETPGPFHIRNSNTVSLTAQVRLAGGEPVPLANARDRVEELSAKVELGLREDILVLSGGVSMGKYDLVESVLKSMGAEFFFDAVAIRPGKPAVFGRCGRTLIFGLPGNPVSTMVTFQLLVIAAMDVLSGMEARPLPLVEATLAENLREKAGLTHFLPARLDWPGSVPQVRVLRWQGSGDVSALNRANCFVVVPSDRPDIAAGEKVSVLPRLDVL